VEAHEICSSSRHLEELFGAEALLDRTFQRDFAGLLIAIHFAAECAREAGLL